MRQQSVITLTDASGRVHDVRVLESTLADLRALIALTPPDGDPGAILAHARTHLPDYLAILADSVILPDGLTLDRLSLSDLEQILSAWWSLHQGFFARALAALGLTLGSAPSTPPATSSGSSPHSPCADSPPPGTGDGATPSA